MKIILRFFMIVLISFFGDNRVYSQWIQTNWTQPIGPQCFAVSKTNLFAGTINRGVFLSTDDGTSWTQFNSGITNDTIQCFGVNGSDIFAGTRGGIFLSTNNGENWTLVYPDLANTSIRDFAAIGTNLFVGTSNGVFLSTDYGKSGITVNSGLMYADIASLAVIGTRLFASEYFGKFYVSTNNGRNWNLMENMDVYSNERGRKLATNANCLYILGKGSAIDFSTDYGANWTVGGQFPISISLLQHTSVTSVAFNGSNIFAGTNFGVFVSSDTGRNWTAANLGLLNSSDNNVLALAICGSNLFASTSSGVWRRPLSEIITDVKDKRDEIPLRMKLNQNFPNPFNPATTISFSLPSKSFVSLKIFDITGREVATLVAQDVNAGNQSLQMDASNLPSGVYFYRLQAGSFTETKKLILLK